MHKLPVFTHETSCHCHTLSCHHGEGKVSTVNNLSCNKFVQSLSLLCLPLPTPPSFHSMLDHLVIIRILKTKTTVKKYKISYTVYLYYYAPSSLFSCLCEWGSRGSAPDPLPSLHNLKPPAVSDRGWEKEPSLQHTRATGNNGKIIQYSNQLTPVSRWQLECSALHQICFQPVLGSSWCSSQTQSLG